MTTIHLVRLRFSNAYLLLGDHRPIIVDTGSRGDERRIQAACAAFGVDPREFGLILHTHIHSDHCGNTTQLADIAGCPISFHLDDQPLARQGYNGKLHGIGLRGRMMSRWLSHLRFRPLEAELPATEGLRLDNFGVGATILHTPGHTAGSISLLMDNGDAIIGDMIMGGTIGGKLWPHSPNFHYFADDLLLAMRSLDRVLKSSCGRLFVGHGGPLDHADVVRWVAAHRLP